MTKKSTIAFPEVLRLANGPKITKANPAKKPSLAQAVRKADKAIGKVVGEK
jgi:hypothetical protein